MNETYIYTGGIGTKNESMLCFKLMALYMEVVIAKISKYTFYVLFETIKIL